MKFCEHLYYAVLERKLHWHCGFTLLRRLRIYFRYDWSLLDLLFKAAASAVQVVLGSDTHSPGLVLTVQTAGEALNFNPRLHGLLADGSFDESGHFTQSPAIDTKRLAAHFCDRVLAELLSRGIITDEVPVQILSQEHSGFGAWVGEAFATPQFKSERLICLNS